MAPVIYYFAIYCLHLEGCDETHCADCSSQRAAAPPTKANAKETGSLMQMETRQQNENVSNGGSLIHTNSATTTEIARFPSLFVFRSFVSLVCPFFVLFSTLRRSPNENSFSARLLAAWETHVRRTRRRPAVCVVTILSRNKKREENAKYKKVETKVNGN